MKVRGVDKLHAFTNPLRDLGLRLYRNAWYSANVLISNSVVLGRLGLRDDIIRLEVGDHERRRAAPTRMIPNEWRAVIR